MTRWRRIINRWSDKYLRIKAEMEFYRLVFASPRTPRLAKFLLGAALAYAVSPVDLIPDFIPGIGHLDDALIVPFLVWLAFKLIPKEVIDECRLAASRQVEKPLQ